MSNVIPAIFIIGPMGAGKTTVGKLLARQLNREFIDSDWYIEEQTGADIPWIFVKEGEEGFRLREARAIEALTQQNNIVLATGGGAVMRDLNRKYLKERGVVVYLRASVKVQLERTMRDKSRPLLQKPNPKKILEELFAIRDPLYSEIADIILTTGEHPPRQMVTKILNKIKKMYPS